ncbi:MAG: SGNH/GDSL hydrolase family protein [Verrucomicrobiota bacterium]
MSLEPFTTALVRIFILILTISSAAALEVLFVGNSFTFGATDTAITYNNAAITDANGTNYGGVPAIFKKLATEGSYPGVNVTIEAVGGQTLAWHLANKSATIDKVWDVVVLQDYSTRPLTGFPGGDVAGFRQSVQDLTSLLRARNPNVRILLYETWARPDLVPGTYATLSAMQQELQSAYSQAASDFDLEAWVPVGDGFLQAVAGNISYDPDAGPSAGKINVWGTDNYHGSNYGYYLSAMFFYKHVLGGDPRVLPTGTGSAVAGLGLIVSSSEALQEIAYDLDSINQLQITSQPATQAVFPGASPRLSVTASGYSALQWRYNGMDIPGADQTSLLLASITPEQAGRYDILVSDSNGTAIVSSTAVITVTTNRVVRKVLVDVGSPSAGYPTASPDSTGAVWNQLTAVGTGTAINSLYDSIGTLVPGLSLRVSTAFSGINIVGVNLAGAYPATAQRDSFFVTGSGSVGASSSGVLTVSGLTPGQETTVRIFASRTTSGNRTGRYTMGDFPPVYLDAADNSANTAVLGPVSAGASGALRLTVAPYNAAGQLQEYAYLGVLELGVSTPQPTGLETWTASHGLAGAVAAAGADPDHDGLPNLVEYALGSAPTQASDANHPVVGMSNDGDFLQLSVPRNSTATGLTLVVEISSDLLQWESGSGNTVVVTDSPNSLVVRDAAPTNSISARFMRLRVQSN